MAAVKSAGVKKPATRTLDIRLTFKVSAKKKKLSLATKAAGDRKCLS